ncbi:Dinitrogenase iron-molybdenum cofactor [Sedimentisphaera cyanobacteriorum]|uniref:Dinitrogenase iron-molybdenum cofactor n=1 Tax=Sedimentisphaera cyanobacteriorum TaxID=1940790 RepID=A0A1Q2HRF3_9BACT|nr:NifB/NifX family molybdenum-iron cluster-binding protein [Sedimentisphaera cyanobacteriorum]AQQ10002.1 Dinitrogenase iron-molybdenum cofactor [Sedimentisphaera cyanobacteriorum]
MKIALPVVNGKLSLHFGHCQSFALVEADENSREIKETEYTQPPPHEPGVLPKWLHDLGADLIIAGGMGQRAQKLFNDNNIEVIVGAESDTPENVVKAYLENTLTTGSNLCDH